MQTLTNFITASRRAFNKASDAAAFTGGSREPSSRLLDLFHNLYIEVFCKSNNLHVILTSKYCICLSAEQTKAEELAAALLRYMGNWRQNCGMKVYLRGVVLKGTKKYFSIAMFWAVV